MTIIATAGPYPTIGLRSERLGRNDTLTDGSQMNRLSSFINMLSTQRLNVLAQGGMACTTSAPGIPTGRARIHTSPSIDGVEVIMILGPSLSSSVLGQAIWTVGGVTQSTIWSGGRQDSAGPGGLHYHRHRFVDGSGADLTGDTVYDCTLSGPNDAAAVLFWIIFEVPRTALDTALHSSASFGRDVFAHGAPILDRDMAKITDQLWEIYRRQGPTQFAWSTANSSSPPLATGTTYENVLDGSTAGYSASAAGFWTIPYRKSRLAGSVVNVKFWACASVNAGSGGRVRFSNSSGVLATITGFTTSIGYLTADATLDATLSSSDLVIVEHSDSGANSITTLAAGCYEYLT